jgi:hypothetical protein
MRVCVRACVQCVKAALLTMEKAGRQEAAKQASKCTRADRAIESAEAGAEAGARAKELKETLDLVKPYYDFAFEDRFIKVPVDSETGQPTEEGLVAVKAELEK